MLFAKVNTSNLIQFPYSWTNLVEENPSSSYDNRFTLVEWYQQTEEGTSTGNLIVPVEELERPTFDLSIQNIIKHTLPTLVEGSWNIGWTITNKTQQEVEAYSVFITQVDHT